MAEDKKYKTPHNLILEGRKNLSVTGVTDIDSFDEETVILYTEAGELSIKGMNLHMNRIDVDTGELSLEGDIYALSYDDNPPGKGGFLSKLFR